MRGHFGTLLRLLGLAAVLALLTACAETYRRPGYPDSSNPPPIPKIFVGEFSSYAVPGLPPDARQLLTDALREHLQDRDLLWTDAINPRIDLTGALEAYEGRYGEPDDKDKVVLDLKGELRDKGKLLASASVNRHVETDADWKDEMAELAESLVDELMRRVAPPPDDGNAGYSSGYGNSAYPYYYPGGGGYYGYDVAPYGYYYGGPSYWWPYYYWGGGGRDFDHHHGGSGGGGGGGFHRPAPLVPPSVFNAVPRSHPGPGIAPSPTPGFVPRSLPDRPRFRQDSSPIVPPAVFDAPRSHPSLQPSPAPAFRSPSVEFPRFRSEQPRPSFSAPPPAMRAPSFSPPSFSAPSFNRAPAMAPPPMRSGPSGPPAGMFRAPSFGGGGGGGGDRRRGR